jgi:hypothetical protein
MRVTLLLAAALVAGLASAVPAQQRPRRPGASKGETPKAYHARRSKELKPDDKWGHLELADICNSTGLKAERDTHANIVLGLAPKNVQAHALLDHVKSKGKWITRPEALADGFVDFHGELIPERELREHVRRRKWENAWEIKRMKITMRTNTSRRKAEKYFATFLQFKKDMERNFGIRLDKKYLVNVYAEKDQYHSIGRGPRGTGGFYSPGGRDFHFFDDPDFFQARRIFFHEGTHMFVNLTNKNKAFRYPNWLNEGMAEYFGGAKLRYQDGSYSFGHILNDRLQVIQRYIRGGITQPLKKFLKQESLMNAYDQGWSVVLFINKRENGKWRKRFGMLLRMLRDHKYSMRPNRRGEGTIEIFERLYLKRGETLDDFEKAWKAWVLELKPEPGAPDFRTMKSMH